MANLDVLKGTSRFYSHILRHFASHGINNATKPASRAIGQASWFKDPLAAEQKLKHKCLENSLFDSTVVHTPQQKIIREIINRRRDATDQSNYGGDNIYQLGEQYLNLEHEARMLEPSEAALVGRKINEILEKRFNYNPVYVGDIYAGCEYLENSIEGVKDSVPTSANTNLLDIKNGVVPNGTVIKMSVTDLEDEVFHCSSKDVFDRLDACVINTSVIKHWIEDNEFHAILYNKAILPLVVSDGKREYKYMRNKCVMFNKSYAMPIEILGENADTFLGHFVTCSLQSMSVGMLQYTCVVDTKGFVMDTGYVAKTNDGFLLITNGLHKRSLYNYMTSYQVSCKNSGLAVNLKPLLTSTVVSLQGPMAVEALMNIVNFNSGEDPERIDVDGVETTVNGKLGTCSLEMRHPLPPFLHSFNSTFRYTSLSCEGSVIMQEEPIFCMRIGDVGEDGIEFLISEEGASHLVGWLSNHCDVITAGFQTYDLGRMEAGIIRSDVDLPTEPSPIQASVAWSVDTHKLRFGSLFGRQHMISQLVNGVPKVRVGLLTNQKVNPLCNILNPETRMPIGFVTSSIWSHGLQMYISQVYVNTEYAKHDMPVYISMPSMPQAPLTKRDYRKYYRNRTKRTFIRGTVVHLPFVYHNYPIRESDKYHVGGRNVPLRRKQSPSNPRMEDEATLVNSMNEDTCQIQGVTSLRDTSNGSVSPGINDEGNTDAQKTATQVKTRKQLWREVIAKHRRMNAKSLEMALQDLEKAKVVPIVSKDNSSDELEQSGYLHINRINLRPQVKMPRDKWIEYYVSLHNEPVPPRHRRYRPPVGQKTQLS